MEGRLILGPPTLVVQNLSTFLACNARPSPSPRSLENSDHKIQWLLNHLYSSGRKRRNVLTSSQKSAEI